MEAEAELVQYSTAVQAPKRAGRAARRRACTSAGWGQSQETTSRAAVAKMQETPSSSRGECIAINRLLSTGVAPLMMRGATQVLYMLATCSTVRRRWRDQPPPSERMKVILAHWCCAPQMMPGVK